MQRRVFAWAHQGGAREAPSNTVHAMERALAAGAHGLEVDVHRTADGHLVLAHDERLERTTDGSGRIADHTLAALERLDAAFWWVPGKVDDHHAPPDAYPLRGRAPDDASLRIPTLAAVLDRFDVPLTIEVKAPDAVAPLVGLLRARRRPPGDLVVTSFREGVVRRLRHLAPELPLAPGRVWSVLFLARVRLRVPPRRSPYAVVQAPHRYAVASGLLGARSWAGRLVPRRLQTVTVVDRRFVQAAHRAGMAVHVWTIDEEDEMRELIAMGVDGIMTDRPSVLAGVLGAGSGRR